MEDEGDCQGHCKAQGTMLFAHFDVLLYYTHVLSYIKKSIDELFKGCLG